MNVLRHKRSLALTYPFFIQYRARRIHIEECLSSLNGLNCFISIMTRSLDYNKAKIALTPVYVLLWNCHSAHLLNQDRPLNIEHACTETVRYRTCQNTESQWVWIKSHLCWLRVLFCQLDKSLSHLGRGETSIEKVFPSHWPADKSVGYFLD